MNTCGEKLEKTSPSEEGAQVIVGAAPDRLVYASKAFSKPLNEPFGERVANPSEYADLLAFEGWRETLGMFWTADDPADYFQWRGKTYRSYAHAYSAAKFAQSKPEEAHKYCVESESEIATKASGWEAHQAAKTPRLEPEQMREWQKTERDIVKEIRQAIFAPDKTPSKVLLATHDAELWIVGGRWTFIGNLRDTRLEKLRRKLRNVAGRKRRAEGELTPESSVASELASNL
jgi:hypothetical protein